MGSRNSVPARKPHLIGRMGHDGSSENDFSNLDRKHQIHGRMGLIDPIQNPSNLRLPRFGRGVRDCLGFQFPSQPPATVVPSISSRGTLAAAMASRGGGNYRGRGPPGGG